MGRGGGGRGGGGWKELGCIGGFRIERPLREKTTVRNRYAESEVRAVDTAAALVVLIVIILIITITITITITTALLLGSACGDGGVGGRRVGFRCRTHC